MTHDEDVLILGAGPVGMTLANELLRHGVRPRIVDRAPGIREVSKALILHVRTQEVLDKVGIATRARDEAQPLREVVVHAYGKHIGSWDLDRIDSAYSHPLILGQQRTQHLLLDLLGERGLAVEWNTEAVALEIGADGATTQLRRGDPDQPGQESVRSRFVVGCEGSNSLVRRTLGLRFDGERYSGEQFIQADCRIAWALPTGRSYLFLTADGYMMVIEMPDGVVRIFISLPDHTAPGTPAVPPEAGHAARDGAPLGAVEATSETPTLDEIREQLQRLSGFQCTLSDPIWLARYRTSHRYADRFSSGCAFVAGDAGHVHVPIGGQGMNTGIQDAFNLGWKLAGVLRGELQPTVLDSYHAERHPVAEGLIRGTHTAYTGILHPGMLKQHAARWFGPFLITQPRVQGFMRETLEELAIAYPASPLNLDLGGADGPRPGERVLDATVVRADSHATVALSELTRTTRWTLLLFCGAAAGTVGAELLSLAQEVARRHAGRIDCWQVTTDAAGGGLPDGAPVLLDVLAALHHRYGITAPAFYLLRPDTHVAARGPIHEHQRLLAHLATIFR